MKIIVGGGLAQGIQLIALPLLSILYLPKDIGGYFEIISFVTILAVIFSLQLQHSIPSQKKNEDVIGVIYTVIFISLVFALIGFFIHYYIGLLESFVWLVIMAFSTTVNNLLKSLMVREGFFNVINIFILIRTFFIVLFQIYFAKYSNSKETLFLGFIIGEVFSFFFISFACRKYFYMPKKGFLLKTLKNNKAYIYYGTPQELLAVTTLGMPIIIIGYFLGSEFAGQFGMAQRLVLAPAAIALGAIVSVIQHEYGRRDKKEYFKSFLFDTKKVLFFLFLISLICFVSVDFFMELILDDVWGDAINASKYIAVWGAALVVSAPYRAYFRIYAAQHLQLSVDVCCLVIIFMLCFVFVFFPFSFDLLVLMFSAIGFLQNFVIIILVLRLGYISRSGYGVL